MSDEPKPAVPASDAESDPHSSAEPQAAEEPPSTVDEPLRHPTGPAAPQSQISAADAQPGDELRANTGMFPVQTHAGGHSLERDPKGRRLAVLTLTALGVVYGDIGTSPLYALKECFSPHYGLQPTRDNVFGILSLIVWALTLVVTVKYVSFVLKADNRGEGGTFALLALIFPRRSPDTPMAKGKYLVALALFGTACCTATVSSPPP